MNKFAQIANFGYYYITKWFNSFHMEKSNKNISKGTENTDNNRNIDLKELKKLRDFYSQYIIMINKNNPKANSSIDLSIIYPDSDNIDDLTGQVIDLKKCLDSFRPLNPEQVNNLQEYFDVNYTYESNRIEGNTLTLNETYIVLQKGITIDGKSVKEHLEVINHHEAFEYIKEIADKQKDFTEDILLKIHDLILHAIDSHNAGKYRNVRVFISGSRHVPPNPLKVADLMKEYFEYYEDNKNKLHPVSLASDMHEKLVTIHPFIDGNGRTARLVMNLILLRNGYPIVNISGEKNKRSDYYDSLDIVRSTNDLTAFRKLIIRYCKESFYEYLKMVSENIDPKEQDKGYYFFKRIEPVINMKKNE